MLKTHIIDGTGTKRHVTVDDQNALVVSLAACPPMMQQKNLIFRQYLTTNGTATGTSAMKVTGSLAAPISYYIPAHQNNDRYITTVSFMVSGTGAAMNIFAGTPNAPTMTNGCKFYYTRSSGEVITIHDAIKTNWDLVRLCMGVPAFGATTNTFIASNVSGSAEGIIPVFNFLNIMPQYGLKLDAGSEQSLTFQIRDDLNVNGVTAIDAIAYGFERLP